jgi:hypothetical protein
MFRNWPHLRAQAAQAEERVAALAAQREAVSSAARERIAEQHPETAERMGLEGARQHAVRDGHQEGEAAGGRGGGLLSSLAHTFADVLGLGGGGGAAAAASEGLKRPEGEQRRHDGADGEASAQSEHG